MGRTELSPEEEARFRKFYASAAAANGLDADPDSPLHKYDYRGAWLHGHGPTGEPGKQHWPSQFKDDDHPNRFVRDSSVAGGMLDTKRDKPVSRNRQPQIDVDKYRAALEERYRR
ncbi:MAG: hypothetical protein WC829_02630 [Hyphomicrobium sp.]|jgi:hypothetical protein